MYTDIVAIEQSLKHPSKSPFKGRLLNSLPLQEGSEMDVFYRKGSIQEICTHRNLKREKIEKN
ncbi:hypothetical protein [Aquimarina gracilis]|uniref:hypothetical protein n=1 Tax=Aquimarina gracilis TaxID=874422 RepID=UPI0031CFA122